MIILFTGHRDKFMIASTLETLAKVYANDIWLHGGAMGFDMQVSKYARQHSIQQRIIRPDYDTYSSKQAPIIRNKQMVDMCNIVIACYDGRLTGGTKFTVDYARKNGKIVMLFNPAE